MTDIYIGMRVFVGYTQRYDPDYGHAMCQTGTISEGPFPPGIYESLSGEKVYVVNNTSWNIEMDSGDYVHAEESIIFREDGDDLCCIKSESEPSSTVLPVTR